MASFKKRCVYDLERTTGDSMSNAFDLGASTTGGNFNHGGLANTFSFLDYGLQHGDFSLQHGGLASAWGGVEVAILTSLESPYGGYLSTFGASSADNPITIAADEDPILLHPKDQKIYYKLKGYNNNTNEYETWIIQEEIVPRPETFNPSGSVPNIDLNVFFAPPSGNTLTNIRIVGRWIQ